MSGVDFIRAVKSISNSTKIIVMSAFEPARHETESSELNIGVIIAKPFSPEKMLRTVQGQLGTV
jgi:two-component SAPR family response regulator